LRCGGSWTTIELVVTLPAVASRTDHGAGTREEVEFLGDGERVFSCLHRPLTDARAGVLVCSPVAADFGANYRREVELGRRLAARGIALQRIHYRGSGHSDGDRAELGYASMFDDARLGLRHLAGQVGDVPLALVGTRCGAIVAAEVARDLDAAPVVLWEPVLANRDFVRDALRARAVHATKKAGRDHGDPDEELAREGWVDVVGIQLGRALIEADEALDRRMGPQPRPILLVQLDPAAELRRGYRSVVAAWTGAGFDVETTRCPIDETWWFTHDRLTPLDELLDRTIGWLVARLAPAEAAPS
jgi:alpha/beta superfamily hydrolase